MTEHLCSTWQGKVPIEIPRLELCPSGYISNIITISEVLTDESSVKCSVDQCEVHDSVVAAS